MLKNWKSLFVKTGEEETTVPGPPDQPAKQESLSFPVGNDPVPNFSTTASSPPATASNPAVNEVIKVYEDGLESINMPGYDFFEFYKAVSTAGHHGSQMYNMAFQMASALDSTITVQKLVSDADFYISKINEVHSQYASQGQQRLNDINGKKQAEKSKLSNDIELANQRITQLRTELQNLENDVKQNRNKLLKIDEGYIQQENSIREKMAANDTARNSSIEKLNTVKNGISNFIK
jgi:hypothetical protein